MKLENTIIVGGGVAGLIAARLLKQAGIGFSGVEKDTLLGGRAELGPHRLLRQESVAFFREQVPDVEWQEIHEEARERAKGGFLPIKDGYEESEKFYLTSNFFSPQCSFDQVIEKLSVPVSEQFLVNKEVEKIEAETKTISFRDGTFSNYEKIIWCADLKALMRVWKGPALSLRGKKSSEKGPGGVTLDLELDKPLFEGRNTVVFTFRYKENRLRALGIPEFAADSSKSRLQWLVFLEPEVLEDREETAKCLRTLKRELQKEFPELKDQPHRERIVYLPTISGETPHELTSLALAPGIYYLGPQASADSDENPLLLNLDRILANTAQLKNSLLGL